MATYAQNPKALAKALGLKPTRAVFKQIAIWIDPKQTPSFPQKVARKGWPIKEVQVWYRHLLNAEVGGRRLEGRGQKAEARGQKSDLRPQTSDPSPPGELPAQEKPAGEPADLFFTDAEKFKARLDHNLDIYLNPGKHLTPAGSIIKLNGQEIAELRQYKRIPTLPDDDIPEPDPDDATEPSAVALGYSINQSALTETMARHFGQKYGFIISENKVSEWLRGKGIPPGCPPPPTKLKGRFNNSEWARWIELCFGRSGADPQAQLIQDDYRRLDKAKLDQAVADAGLSTLKFDIEKGLYIAKSELGPLLDAARAAYVAVADKVEQIIPRATEAALKEFEIPEAQRQGIMERVRAASAALNDELRRAPARELQKLKESLKPEI